MDTKSLEMNTASITELQLLRCPISLTFYCDPVIAEDGYTYERAKIEAYFETKLKSPMTNKPIGKSLTPNLILKQIIQNVFENNSNLQKEFEESNKEFCLGFGKELYATCKFDGSNINKISLLINQGADVNWQNKKGKTPLFAATFRNHISAAQLLLDNGAKVDMVAGTGDWGDYWNEASPLSVAMLYGNVEMVDLLLNRGADLYQQNKTKKYMLVQYACHNDHVRVMQNLIDNGADVNRRDTYSSAHPETPLIIACKFNSFKVARLLLEKGADIDLADTYGMTPLFIACQKRYVDAARLLLDNGADVDKADKEGRTPLYAACDQGNVEIAQLLLEKGTDINKANEHGFTHLHIACQKGNIKVVQWLIDNNANVNCVTKKGQRPIDVACEMNHFDIAKKLCRVNCLDCPNSSSH